MPSPTRVDPFLAGNFQVTIDGVGTIAFSEVQGLEVEIEIVNYRNGSDKENSERKLPGLRKYSNITLKRGYVPDASLWNWFKSVLTGTLERTTVSITLLDAADNPAWTWVLTDAWPCRYTGPTLVANSSEVAIETIEIVHEGLEVNLQA